MITPDFNDLPSLERLMLLKCENLLEIHPSIGYHKRLVHVNMTFCKALKTFPPIKWMPQLETLKLAWCSELQKFPDVQTRMDSLLNLCLSRSGIRIIPPSVGEFCTNLVSFDLWFCDKLERIEFNLHLLKSLQVFDLRGCQVLSTSVMTKFTKRIGLLPRFLRKLNLSRCNLGDGDIPDDLSELLNLQLLNLTGNDFSRLHSTLSRIPCLKFLNLSNCKRLVELPDFPSSIAILKADDCVSLERVGDLSKYKCLWKVSLDGKNKLIDDKRALVHSLLQGNALEDRFMSVTLPHIQSKPDDEISEADDEISEADDEISEPDDEMSETDDELSEADDEISEPDDEMLEADDELSEADDEISETDDELTTSSSFTLQLPHNWHSDFSGFLFFYPSNNEYGCIIVIKQQEEMSSTDSQPAQDQWEEFDKNLEYYEQVGYVPFASLSHIPWWNNSTYTKNISFKITMPINVCRIIPPGVDSFKAGLVPRKSKSVDSSERAIEFWDEESKAKTFEIIDHSKSSKIKIVWYHC